jgi:DNA-binding IclR family transcriptional regulator
MKAITKASRVNTALQVIQHMNDGMTVVEACKEVGIPRSSFYYIVDNNPEAIAEIQTPIDANNREQLGLILLTKTEILRKLVEEGLSDKTNTRDRLAIYLKLNELENELAQNMQIENDTAKQAREFLRQGPMLVHGESRYSATQMTVTIESGT